MQAASDDIVERCLIVADDAGHSAVENFVVVFTINKKSRPWFRHRAEPVAPEYMGGAQVKLHCAFPCRALSGKQCDLSQWNALEYGPFLLGYWLVVPIGHVDPGERLRIWRCVRVLWNEAKERIAVKRVHALLAALAMVRMISALASPVRKAALASAARASALAMRSISRCA